MSTAPLPPQSEPARIIVVMGVAAAGKTATGKAIARRLHAPFLDADAFHPQANIEKMSAGIPLTDEDRWPWLGALAKALHAEARRKGVVIGACSALKRSYRNHLVEKAGEPILFVHLSGSRDVLATRIARRPHHFMPASLLDSQLATLEPPGADENAITFPATDAVEKIAGDVLKATPHLRSFKRWQ